jgi:hypothetical protein
MISVGIEPATFRFVTEYYNYATAYPREDTLLCSVPSCAKPHELEDANLSRFVYSVSLASVE